jgi:hypothetical protein
MELAEQIKNMLQNKAPGKIYRPNNNEMNYTEYMKRNATIYIVAYRPIAKW